MPANRPEELDRLFEQGWNAGQVDALVALYEPEAVLIWGKVAKGTQAIKELLGARRSADQRTLSQMLGAPLQVKTIAQTGDLAVTSANGGSAEVSRRQADGTWRFVIDIGEIEWLKRTDT